MHGSARQEGKLADLIHSEDVAEKLDESQVCRHLHPHCNTTHVSIRSDLAIILLLARHAESPACSCLRSILLFFLPDLAVA